MARCPTCGGEGTVAVVDDANERVEPAPCPTCGGSGELGDEQPELI